MATIPSPLRSSCMWLRQGTEAVRRNLLVGLRDLQHQWTEKLGLCVAALLFTDSSVLLCDVWEVSKASECQPIP